MSEEKTKEERLQDIVSLERLKSNPGHFDLMRRLYTVHTKVGGYIDDKYEQAFAPLLNERRESGKNEKKQDQFEIIKVKLHDCVELTLEFIRQRDAGQGNARMNNEIRKNIQKLKDYIKQLEHLQENATKKRGIWGKKPISEELKKQRDKDIEFCKEHVKHVIQMDRAQFAGKSASKRQKSAPRRRGDAIENMKDESQNKDLPKIDISEGLKQIEEDRKLIYAGLDRVYNNLEQLGEMTKNIGTELDKQAKLLDKIEKDVDNYNSKLEGLNKTLDKALEKVGGATRGTLFLIGLVILFLAVGVVYFIVEFYLKK